MKDMNTSVHAGFTPSVSDVIEPCYPIICSFLFGFVRSKTSAVEDQFTDLKIVASFRLVSVNFNESFRAHEGYSWTLIAKGIHDELKEKSIQIDTLDIALSRAHLRGVGPFVRRNHAEACTLRREIVKRQGELRRRCASIHCVLLPKVNDLALSSGGDLYS